MRPIAESQPRVFVTRVIPEAGLNILHGSCEADVWPGPLPPSREVLLDHVRGCEGILSLLTDRIDAAVMEAAGPQLAVISNFAVGVDNVDVAAATARGVPVGHTPGVLTETTADLAWALLMAAARRVAEGDHYVRDGQWRTWEPRLLLGVDVHRATLGLVGFGRIGQAMARRARGFEMTVIYSAHREEPSMPEATWVDLPTLLRASDFVSIHVPLTGETNHMFDAQAFGQMKREAILINTARGGIVDSAALYDALISGSLRGAALDVTDPEPIEVDSPLLTLRNCLVVPHIGSASIATRDLMAEMAARNLLAGLRGDRLPYCVNPGVYGS